MLLSCLCHLRLDVSITGSDTRLPGSALPAPSLPHFPVAHNLTSWTPPARHTAPCSLAGEGAELKSPVCRVLSGCPGSAVHEPREVLTADPSKVPAHLLPPILAVSVGTCGARSLLPASAFLLPCSPGAVRTASPRLLSSFSSCSRILYIK